MNYDDLISEARYLVNEKRYEEAVKKYEQAFELDLFSEDYIEYAFLLLKIKQYDKAKEAILDLLSNIEFASGYYVLGIIESTLNNYVEAIDNYKKCLEIDPGFIDARYNLGYIYDNFDELKLAEIEYKKVLELDNENYWAHLNLGSLYERQDIDDKALYHFLLANEIDKSEKMASYNIGVVYGKMKKYDLSKKYYLEELTKKEPFIYTYLNLGLLYKEVYKDKENAIKIYLQGIEKDSSCGVLWYNLGCIYALNENFSKAYDFFRQSFFKDETLIEYIKTDDELESFRKHDLYQKLMKEFE